jgi:hypothetical protein
MSADEPWLPAGAEVVALRYVLAMARRDHEAAEAVVRDMDRFEPGLIVGALACSMIDFVRAASAGSDENVVASIEQWLQSVLDAELAAERAEDEADAISEEEWEAGWLGRKIAEAGPPPPDPTRPDEQ